MTTIDAVFLGRPPFSETVAAIIDPVSPPPPIPHAVSLKSCTRFTTERNCLGKKKEKRKTAPSPTLVDTGPQNQLVPFTDRLGTISESATNSVCTEARQKTQTFGVCQTKTKKRERGTADEKSGGAFSFFFVSAEKKK